MATSPQPLLAASAAPSAKPRASMAATMFQFSGSSSFQERVDYGAEGFCVGE